MRLMISGPSIYTEKNILTEAVVVIEKNTIQQIDNVSNKGNLSADEIIHFPANYHIVSGFIDLHVHGANNQDVMDATPSALKILSETLAAEGTTGFLATTMTASSEKIENALIAVRDYLEENKKNETKGATILGIHLEGPFVSPQKTGAQRADQLLIPDIALLKRWQSIAGNSIKLVTLAPELSNSPSFIRYLKQQNIIASMGHSDATYAEAMTAITEGVSYATHVFNAMRSIHQREPGLVMAALLSEQVVTELIVDGMHLHPAIVDCILKLKGIDKMVLVTDAMRAKCLGDGVYDLGGQSVKVDAGVATVSEGVLAGSTLKMPTAIQNMIRFTKCSLFDAVKMASENPAKTLGIFDKKGSIAIGKDADLVVLDQHYSVVMTVCSGKIVYRRGSSIHLS